MNAYKLNFLALMMWIVLLSFVICFCAVAVCLFVACFSKLLLSANVDLNYVCSVCLADLKLRSIDACLLACIRTHMHTQRMSMDGKYELPNQTIGISNNIEDTTTTTAVTTTTTTETTRPSLIVLNM